ncbi:hypothetical protein D3C77_807900 [compost metagenome]
MGLAVPAVDIVGGRFRRQLDAVIVEHVVEELGQGVENIGWRHGWITSMKWRVEKGLPRS